MEVPFDLGLETGDEFGETAITLILKLGDDSSLEEDLGESDTELVLSDVLLLDESGHHGAGSLLRVLFSDEGLVGGQDGISLDEVGVEGSVGESLTANTDTLEHTVTGQLVEDERGVDHSGLLLLVGDDATDEVGVGLVKHSHQVVQRLAVKHRDRHERAGLSLLLAASLGHEGGLLLGRVVLPDFHEEIVLLGLFHALDDGVVQRVLVLLEPVHHIVTDSSGVVTHGEVSLSLFSLGRLWLFEVGVLAQMLFDELRGQGLVSGFGDDTLLIKHGDNTERLKGQIGAVLVKDTFSISSIQAWRSRPKSMKVHWIPSRAYSSCSRTNMWWLKNCWSFSFTKLIQSCSKELN